LLLLFNTFDLITLMVILFINPGYIFNNYFIT